MPLEGFTPYAKEDAEKYNRMRWWLGMTWGDVFDKATDFLKGRGASVLQLPERVELVAELPLTKVGKVDKKALREDVKSKVEGT